MRSTKILFTTLILSICAAGCVQVGKLVGKLLTSSTNDLNEAATQVRFVRNTYPPETNTTEAQYFENWAAGRNIVAITSFKRDGAGMLKIDGTVNANGEPLTYVANGSYGKFTDELSTQKIDIETNAGQKVSFEVSPIEEVKIKSINNGSGVVNLYKDLVIELEEPANTKHQNMRVMLLMKVLGALGWVDIANFKAADRVVIPAETFRHLPGVKPESGDSYLLVERYDVSPNIHEGIGAAQILSLSWDAVPVKVEGKTDPIYGIPVSDQVEDKDGVFEYTITKPNAFLGKPLNKAKKLALTSLTVRATKLKQSRTDIDKSTTYQRYGDTQYKITTTTITTETRKFPKLPEVFWDNLLNSVYDDVTAILSENLGAEFIPMDQVLAAPSYKELIPIEDGITEVEVSKTYKGTKPLLPTTLPAIMSNISTTFATDRVDARLINELGVDALVAITIDLEMPWEEYSLSPRLSFRITGAPNGYLYGPTVYAEGIISGNGIVLDEAKNQSEVSLELLNKVVRKDALMDVFRQAVQGIKAEENKYGYEEIWALQD